ncbi:hypothetical protein [uncultured Friedmanniella sp.]|uniref:hypothetical protein n=1 Tax=uncultured Friedmanniella sp. TaxID=335381 RepID=UPI0035CB80A1
MTAAHAQAAAPTAERLRPERTDATRYLCAAAYLDEDFARTVLDEVLYQSHRSVAPSHGFSVVPVVRHCLATRRRTLLRDAVVTVLLLAGLVASPTAGVVLAMTVLSLWLLVRGVGLLYRRQVTAGLVHVGLSVLVGPLATAVLLVGPNLLSGMSVFALVFYGLQQPGALLGRWFFTFLAGLLIWLTYFLDRLKVHQTIAVELTRDVFEPDRAPAAGPDSEQRLDYLDKAQQGNLTLYSESAGADPFVGFGDVYRRWSLVAPLRAAGPAAQPGTNAAAVTSPEAVPFSTDELYEAIRSGMVDLGQRHRPQDDVMPHLSVRDRVFVAGRLPTTSEYLFQGRPLSRLFPEQVRQVGHTERGRVRHYQAVRMAAWNGELEVTTFLHASQRGRMLFIEFVATVMPGIRPAYRRIDTYDRFDVGAKLRAAGLAVGDLIRSPRAVLNLVARASAAVRRSLDEASEDQRIGRQLAFDYGSRVSVREMGSNPNGLVGFQLYDADERMRIIERHVVEVLAQFLRHHGYDLSEFAGQMSTVINSTRIENSNTFNNSTLNSSSVAAGSSASASASTVSQSQPSTSPVPPT